MPHQKQSLASIQLKNLTIAYTNHPRIYSKTYYIYSSESKDHKNINQLSQIKRKSKYNHYPLHQCFHHGTLMWKASGALDLHMDHERSRIMVDRGLNAQGITTVKKQHLKLRLSCKEKQTSVFKDSDKTKPNSISIWQDLCTRYHVSKTCNIRQ